MLNKDSSTFFKFSILLVVGFFLMVLKNYSYTFHNIQLTFVFSLILYITVGFLFQKYPLSSKTLKIIGLSTVTILMVFSEYQVNPRWDGALYGPSILIGLTLGLSIKRSKWYYGGVTLVSIIAFFIFTFIPTWEYNTKAETYFTPLSNTTFLTLDSTQVELTDFQGKVVLLDFWFSRCGYCFKQIEETHQIYEQFKDQEQVLIYGVNTGDDTFERTQDFVKRFPFPKDFQTLYSTKENSVLNQLGLCGAPRHLLIDKYGHLRLLYTGYSKDANKVYVAKMAAMIQQLLAE